MFERTTRSEKLGLRLTPEAKYILQTAAASGCSRNQLLLDKALAQATDVLADRRTFVLDSKQWNAFVNALNAPQRTLPRLERLLNKPAFFDVGPLNR